MVEVKTMIIAGKSAPDFTAPAFYQGKFAHIGLSRYRGQWVVLFFYGGDYTFV
jgi:peroxiredoxin (alkyl hydroperoxide reductase subunit C)